MKIGLETGKRRIVTAELIPDRAKPAELSLLRRRLDAVTVPALRNGINDPSYPTSFSVTPQQRSLASAFLLRKAEIEAVPSITCRDCRAEDFQSISRAVSDGIENLLVIHGDPCGDGRDRYEFSRTDELIRQLSSVTEKRACLGAITNQYARKPPDEVSRTLARVEAGAEFVLTNMCFSQERVLEHRDNLLSAGLDVPLMIQVSIPHSLDNLLFVSRKFGLPLEKRLAGRLRRDPWGGVDLAVETFELLKNEASGIHFSYLLRKSNPIPVYSRVLEAIGIEPIQLGVSGQVAQEIV